MIIRKFCAVLVFVAFAIAVGGMACSNTVQPLDNADETDGAT